MASGESTSEASLKKGIDYIYNLEFQKAEKELGRLREITPDDPAPYFYTAMIYWGKLFFNYDRNAIKDLGLWLDRTIEVAEKKYSKNKKDGEALFYLGGGYGFKGRLALMDRNWLQAYFNSRKGNNLLLEAEKLAPDNYDIVLGLGMYNYFLSRIPSVIKVLSFLLFIKSDSELGIKQLELCANKGEFASTEARIVLAGIYTYFEKSHEKAIEHLNVLTRDYPSNPRFLYSKAIAYSKMKDEENATAIASEMEKRINENERSFTEQWRPRAMYLRGEILFEQRKYTEAIPFYAKAIKLSDKNKNDWVAQWCNMKLGMIYDALKKREQAKSHYKKVLELNDMGEENIYVKSFAKKYLSEPYNPDATDNIE